MKRIVFLSSMALDANVSLIRQLRSFYDVYYIILANDGTERLGNIRPSGDIDRADTLEGMSKLAVFIELDKTYVVKKVSKYSPRRIKIEIAIHNVVRELKPDVIVTDSPRLDFLFDRFLYRKKVVSLIHDPFLHSGETTLIRRLGNALLLRFARRYVLFNETQKEKFVRHHGLNCNDVYCTFLSQYEFLTLYDDNGLPPATNDKLNVLFFGRISPYKGIKYLLDGTVKFIRLYGKNIKLVIAGGGQFDFSEYEDIPEVHIINRFIQTNELVRLIKQSDIVVCPYIDATQSGVVMSAYALKKPVLATTVGGLPEMLNNGETGLLIPPKDSNAICESFLKLLQNPGLLREYTDNIVRIYYGSGNKSWEKAAERLRECIDSL